VCTSTVCDTADNKCGYANGDGPCTAATGPKECRSGACSTNGKCEPAGGCNVDADCAAGDWCAEATHTCTPQLANGKPVPTDGPHTNPTLNGTCTAAAGILVCVSAVCDTKDNECGYANGDGPCTVASGTTVCRSAACSTNGTCEPAGGCNVDADCVAADWCAESTHTCTPKLANGTAVATDPAHTNPTLNGTCTAAAGALVCASAVCDTKDNECGYANGDGPCTLADGGTVCRSGTCSSTGVCIAPSTCNVDADCAAGHWCDETAHTCAAQLANGSPVPTDGPHTNPTLNGTCTVAAGTLVCTSGVCDTKDNECGYANGDGPCTTSDGTIVCRSGACSTNGTCEPAGGCNTNADCTDPATPDCNTTTHTCQAVPDAGTDAGGKPDAGADSGEPTVDAAAEAAAEAGADGAVHDAGDATAADATAPEEDAGGDGFVEGGGCAVGRTTDAPPPVLAGLLLALGMGLGARRRRRVG
jgi:MYXO-CTERM domain-containing protein